MSDMATVMREAIVLAGGSVKIASTLIGRDGKPLSRQAVDQWSVVPPRHVLRVEELTGISRYRLRPDLYGPEPRPLARKPRGEVRPAA